MALCWLWSRLFFTEFNSPSLAPRHSPAADHPESGTGCAGTGRLYRHPPWAGHRRCAGSAPRWVGSRAGCRRGGARWRLRPERRPPSWPVCKAAISAGSSTVLPRPTLAKTLPACMEPISSAEKKPLAEPGNVLITRSVAGRAAFSSSTEWSSAAGSVRASSRTLQSKPSSICRTA